MTKRIWYYWYNIVLGTILWQLAVCLLLIIPVPSIMFLVFTLPWTIGVIATGALFPAVLLAYREKRNAKG